MTRTTHQMLTGLKQALVLLEELPISNFVLVVESSRQVVVVNNQEISQDQAEDLLAAGLDKIHSYGPAKRIGEIEFFRVPEH